MAKENKGVFQSLKDIVCFKSEDLVIRLKELSNLNALHTLPTYVHVSLIPHVIKRVHRNTIVSACSLHSFLKQYNIKYDGNYFCYYPYW